MLWYKDGRGLDPLGQLCGRVWAAGIRGAQTQSIPSPPHHGWKSLIQIKGGVWQYIMMSWVYTVICSVYTVTSWTYACICPFFASHCLNSDLSNSVSCISCYHDVYGMCIHADSSSDDQKLPQRYKNNDWKHSCKWWIIGQDIPSCDRYIASNDKYIQSLDWIVF